MTDNNYVTLIDHMGDDLSVVNAARVSFGKRIEYDDESEYDDVEYEGWCGQIPILRDGDVKLIKYVDDLKLIITKMRMEEDDDVDPELA